MVTDGTKYERELEARLWHEGWASFRVAGSGTVRHASADIVAVRNNRVIMFEVKSCWERNMPLDVSEDSEQLRELEVRAIASKDGSPPSHLNVDFVAAFAVRIKDDDTWYACPGRVEQIEGKLNMVKMYKLLMDKYEVTGDTYGW